MGTKNDTQGRPGKASLLGERNNGMPIFHRAENNCVALHDFFVFAKKQTGRREAMRPFASRFGQRRFPNLPYSLFPQIGRA
jgi:hypothetical protein